MFATIPLKSCLALSLTFNEGIARLPVRLVVSREDNEDNVRMRMTSFIVSTRTTSACIWAGVRTEEGRTIGSHGTTEIYGNHPEMEY